MAGIVRDASGKGEEALAIARELVDLANRRGGHDNITAAVLRFRPIKPEAGRAAGEEREIQ
jgi:serine/threonine protein phosphatase PrpC